MSAAGSRLALAGALALAGCNTTDVVATAERRGSCSDGSCADADSCAPRACAPLADRAALCAGGAEQARAGDSCEAGRGAPGARYVLCSCTDLVSSSAVRADAFRGTLNRPAAGQARIGVNGDLTSPGGHVDGALEVGGRANVGSGFVSARPIATGAAPCACGADALLDIAALVAARADDNDNGAAGLARDELDGFSGARELTLDCGRYYFTRFKGEQPLTLRTRGDVAIFVEQGIELGDSFSVRTDGRGHASLFVAGDMHVGGALRLGGDANGASRADLYLASSGALEVAGGSELIGRLYAPRAELVSLGALQLYGSMFVRRAAPGGELSLHYDTRAESPGACGPLP